MDHAGHSELLKLSVIESVFNPAKSFKPEFRLKTCLLAAEAHVEMDAMEDIHLLPGTGSRERELLPDGYTTLLIGACHTLLLHVIITLLENMDLVEAHSQPLDVKIHVQPDTAQIIQMINGSLTVHIQCHHKFKRSKLKL